MDSPLEESNLQSAGSKATDTRQMQSLANMLGMDYAHRLEVVSPPRELLHGDFSRIIGSWGKQHGAIPFKEEDNKVFVAIVDPRQTEALDALRFCYGRTICPVVVPEEELTRAINSIRTNLMSDKSGNLDASKTGEQEDFSDSLKIDVTEAEDDDAPIIRYVNTLIFRAASQRASDIHVEPFEDCLKVRFRVDGVLSDVDTEDKAFQAAILSRIKVMANLDIAEKRLPQDGRIGLKIAGQDVDIRVSTIPTKYGERIVMRLLDKSKVMISLSSLGLLDDDTDKLNRFIQKSHGIILVTGPTGSGKTTTLYSCLSEINSEDKNILTVEDPIEYDLAGIGQMQANPKIGFTFASGLRSILRQDPDVIMVGEIRDLDTVEIAVQASLTGHLVFSTLHTNDAPGAITRLLDMGVEPFLISSSLLVVVAQRLVRCLCPSCKLPSELTSEQAKDLGIDPRNTRMRHVFKPNPEGCPDCRLTGYQGRTGIHEFLIIDDAVRQKIMQRADSNQIRQAATGLRNLRAVGAIKILDGVTSVEEIIRVTHEEE